MFSFGPLDLLVPVLMILLTVVYLPITVVFLLKDLKFSHLVSWHAFQNAWFERFWAFFGSVSMPLFTSDVETVLANASGVVLDVGPGSGAWMYLFSPRRNPNISKLLLLEPNENFHQSLKMTAEEHGLAGRYEILGNGTTSLEKIGIQTGSIDTITTVHVLCSVSQPHILIKDLYRYLKPGGQWLVYEHVRVKGKGAFIAYWQAAINIIWLQSGVQ
ncbi:class I SAM-dependent methyltransferase [Aspergillus candidus]|uniref:S-adenosyl-L-methionine-dependent methyltransferase n=1 Tax=Aspergillus candidus TaxID=41067 RepID=A0A2I2F456_ASPCN|nr:S-adenosyl-L-methionine-dependent methyltransferase [Aspergillus candidus]PLB35420.1 S-adenosyl-L-methionine-dependent methyltransferase [Aspergillus candidus]